MNSESELFAPVKTLFENMGYQVNAEVKNCDVTAIKDDQLIITELKRSLCVDLLAQGLKRQKTGAITYIAVPKPKKYSPKTFRDKLYVIKKLELGLIFVSLLGSHSYAEIIYDPKPFKPVRKDTVNLKRILNEIDGRSIDTNIGGVTGRKIATAYTEKCIHIACILDMYGELSPKEIRNYGGDKNCTSIMRTNAYGWFEHVKKGIYSITTKGRKDLLDYPELEQFYTERLLNKKDL